MISTGAILILVLFAFAASFTQRVSGFGFGILMMTVLPHLCPTYVEATALSGLLALANASIPAVKKRKHLVWRKSLPIMLTFLLVSFVFVKLVGRVDSHSLKKVLGAILILVSIYFFFVSEKIRIKPSVPLQVGLGTLSGAMGGLFAMQGPPAVIYFIGSAESRDEYIASTQWYFLVGNLMMSVFRASEGFVTRSVLVACVCALPALLAGLWLGGKVSVKMDMKSLRKVIYAYMALAGVAAIIF